MKGLRFLSLLTFLVTIASVFYVIIDTGDYHSLFEDIEAGTSQTLSLTQKIRSYFAYADSWNYLILAAFISSLFFLFVLNDYIVGRFLKSRSRKQNASDAFISGGFTWLFRMMFAAGMVFAEFVIITHIVIYLHAKDKIIVHPQEIQGKKAVLLLGTNKQTQSGNKNLYYYARIDAVVDLYRAGKIKKIVISGDNSRKDYNEPRDMMRDLVKRGVPEGIILLDYAGFRTLDSVVRLKLENNVTDVVIVSQKFHVERALFLSWFYNIKATAYAARGTMTDQMLKRELLAKPKVLMDLFLFNMQPKYGRTKSRPGIDLNKDKDIVLLLTVGTLVIISGILLKNTFMY
ncbi:MAG TPA: ElyC/SanA/YdcF family protein [Cytophagales bacterium]|nr:ElyC/SanA/YdcF family protein [Cytophagales bacterium]